MRHQPVILLLLLLAGAPVAAQRPASPVVLSVGDIVSNYGIDSAWLSDTAHAVAYLDAQPQDYVALTNLCVSIRTRAQQVIHSIENDYETRDSLVWIDSSTVLADYAIYEYRLRRLADQMGRLSVRYSRMEQQRIEAEKKAEVQRAREEARRQQEERDRVATDLRSGIEVHHRAIIAACDGTGLTDRAKLKTLKDLYYSYLMVYNKYDLSGGPATEELIVRLDELNAFQNDMLENVLGNNSLPQQIENFKNILKVRCENENGDVYRSYTRVFKHTSVPVSFADLPEYEDYINRMRTIVVVQNRYLQTLDLRATIASGTAAIEQLYGRRHKGVLASYREVLRTVDQVPAFTTNAESVLFIQRLEDFAAAQQAYIDQFAIHEEIAARGDSIVKGCGTRFTDVANAYRGIEGMLTPQPSFTDEAGAMRYEERLDEVKEFQRCYQEALRKRKTIAELDDSLGRLRKLDRILANGYRLLAHQTDLRPSFVSPEQGQHYLSGLDDHIAMQRICLQAMHKLDTISLNERYITAKDQPFRNIARAYSRMARSIQAVSEIVTLDDLRRYNRQCDNLLEVQEAFRRSLRSEYAMDIDNRMKRETDIGKIRVMVGMQP